MNLNDEQKEAVAKAYAKTTDLNEITREVFNNPQIDGRSKEGRLVRSYLIEKGFKFKTARRTKQEGIQFTKEQEEFIVQQANTGLSSLAIAEMLFPKKEVKPLSLEQRAVHSIIKEINPDYSPSQDSDVGLSSYVAPKSTSRIVKKINDATGSELQEDKINRQHKVCVEKLGILSLIHI